MKKISAIALSACFLLLPLSACGEDDGGLTKLEINEVTHSIFYAPLYLADALGYFEEENLKIELTNGGGADKVMSAVLSGDADIGFCGPEAALYVLVGGSSDVPTVFGQLTKRDGSFLVAKAADPDFEWTKLRGKHVLAGRVGGVPAMTMQYVVNKAGLDEKTDLKFNTDVAFNMMAPVFESDDSVDYTTMFEPTASEFAASGKGFIVASVGEAGGEIPYTSFSASKSYLEKNPELVKNFLRAIIKGYGFIKDNTPEKVAESLEPSFSGTSRESLAAAVKSYTKIDAWCSTPLFTEEAYIKLQEVMENAGFLDARVTYTGAVDNSFVNAVLENKK